MRLHANIQLIPLWSLHMLALCSDGETVRPVGATLLMYSTPSCAQPLRQARVPVPLASCCTAVMGLKVLSGVIRARLPSCSCLPDQLIDPSWYCAVPPAGYSVCPCTSKCLYKPLLLSRSASSPSQGVLADPLYWRGTRILMTVLRLLCAPWAPRYWRRWAGG